MRERMITLSPAMSRQFADDYFVDTGKVARAHVDRVRRCIVIEEAYVSWLEGKLAAAIGPTARGDAAEQRPASGTAMFGVCTTQGKRMNVQDSRRVQRDSAGEESDIALLRSVVKDEDVFLEILELFGGTTVYIPKLDRRARNKRIRSTYHELMTTKGMPSSQAVAVIAHHEGVTTQCIYRLLSKREKD